MTGARALQVALDWMAEGLPQCSSGHCRGFRDAMQASRSHNALLYRLRLSSAGPRLQRMRATELQVRIGHMTDACV